MPNASLPPQKQLTAMLGHPVAENPIDQMFDAVYAHYGLHWQFWKSDVTSEDKIAAAIAGIRALGFAGACITVPYKVVSIPHLDEVDGCQGDWRGQLYDYQGRTPHRAQQRR